VPAATGDTVAVKVTGVPNAAGDGGLAAIDVVVAAAVDAMMPYVRAGAVDARKAAESAGVKTADIGWLPTLSEFVANDAWPPDTVCAVPISADPSLNCTDPAAPCGLTVAVKVTVVPAPAGEMGLADTAVDVAAAGAAVIVKGSGAAVDAPNAVRSDGVNTAVIEWLPTESPAIDVDASPAATV
jgi:hypothetical protein